MVCRTPLNFRNLYNLNLKNSCRIHVPSIRYHRKLVNRGTPTINHATASAGETEPKARHEDQKEENSRGRARGARKRKFIGFSEHMEMKRQQRMDKPRNWVERKLAVGIVIGLAGYAWYVYIGRFCVPMLRRDADALGGRGMGGECHGPCFIGLISKRTQ